MLDILTAHLQAASTPEQQAIITEAVELFEVYELDDYERAYTDVLMTADNADVSETTNNVMNLTSDFQDFILGQMGVELNEHATIKYGNLVLRSLKLLESTEQAAHIAEICDEAVDHAEALCEILSLLSGVAEEDFYTVIDHVSPFVLERIKETCNEISPGHGDPVINVEENKALLNSLLRFKDMLSSGSLRIYDALIKGEQIGLPFAHYYPLVFNQTEQLTPSNIACQLFAATLVSSDARFNPQEKILEQLNTTYTSLDDITPIAMAVEKWALAFHSAETSGVKRETA